VAAVYVEWIVCRAIIGLSGRPNLDVRHDLVRVFGLDKYKRCWWAELQGLPNARRLPEVVANWHAVTLAFDARDRLVHGRDRYTQRMAGPHVEALLSAVADICAYARECGVDINRRLPQRRRRKVAAEPKENPNG